MALGFGTTHGTAATDRLSDTLLAGGTTFTWAAWLYRHADGGNSQGRWFQADDGAVGNITVGVFDATNMFINLQWSGGIGQWVFTKPTTDTWMHYAITYNAGATTNNPSAFINGADQGALTQNGADPSGAWTTATRTTFIIGNRNTADRGWDGMIAEHAQWNRILTANELASLADAMAPSLLPVGLVHYRPLIRNPGDWGSAGASHAGTVTGAVVQPHPRIIRRTGPRFVAAVSTFTSGTGGRRTLSDLGTRMGSRQVQEA